MRTRTHSIVTALVLLTLVSGAIGCRSNGVGPWYSPGAYSFYNPFKETEAPPYQSEGTAQANAKPSLDATPNVQTPLGGYATKPENSEKVVVTQYGQSGSASEFGLVASNAAAPAANAYSEPSYNPYPNAATGATATSQGYMPTRYHQQDPGQATPSNWNGASMPAYPEYQAPAQSVPATPHYPSYSAPATMTESVSPYGAVPSNTSPYGVVPSNSSPYGAAPANTSPYGAAPANTSTTESTYGNAQATYGAQAATPYNVDTVTPGYGSGYSTTPPAYHPANATGGF